MVNSSVTDGWRRAERRMILTYAPMTGRAGLAALLALDDTLAAVLRTVREPMVAQMRMTWWHDALIRLDNAAPPAEPVLRALARDVMTRGITGAELSRIVEGWEELLEPGDLDDAALMRFAEGRGTVFEVGGRVLRADGPLAEAGQGWALADLTRHSRDPARAAALASPFLDSAAKRRWSSNGRALGAMVHMARMGDAGPGRRTMRALWHRATGW